MLCRGGTQKWPCWDSGQFGRRGSIFFFLVGCAIWGWSIIVLLPLYTIISRVAMLHVFFFLNPYSVPIVGLISRRCSSITNLTEVYQALEVGIPVCTDNDLHRLQIPISHPSRWASRFGYSPKKITNNARKCIRRQLEFTAIIQHRLAVLAALAHRFRWTAVPILYCVDCR